MTSTLVNLTANGVGLVLDVSGPALPRVLHWGAAIGEPGEADRDLLGPGTSLLPAAADGWTGRPALTGFGAGRAPFLRLALTEPVAVDGSAITVRSADVGAGVAVVSELSLDAHGVTRLRHTVTNTGDGPWRLGGLLAVLPLPDTAGELLDFTGRWCRERAPQRAPLNYGTNLRESHRGRSGFDSTGLLLAGTPGFGFRHGDVRAMHVAWSGNNVQLAERTIDAGTVLGGGELLETGELSLAPGESYATPWVWFVHSAEGMDGVSARLHASLRARPNHPSAPRPLTFNTWEAVYFDMDVDRLKSLADLAAGIGAERYVLDDGWFLGRRDDTAGLGDWIVDPAILPDGLTPIIEHVRGLGLQFGLWVEPEMINPDSDVFRAHPDWVLAGPDRLPVEWRNQHVLDVANPDAYAYLLEHLDALLTEYDISYLKWDHNRELVEPVHDGRPGVHAQTLAVYRLFDELRARHPGVEIESCSSGGGRVDLGILERTDRVWASDCTDPIERQAIQRWTSLLIPYELIGAHVSSPSAHTTHRVTSLGLRAATALFGHAGIEWDISSAAPDERDELRNWIAAYKRLRPLLHAGTVVRADQPVDAPWLYGVVADDRRSAIFAYVALQSTPDEGSYRLRLPGLDPTLRYTVRALPELVLPETIHDLKPEWLGSMVTLSGAALGEVGLLAPQLLAQQALVVELTAAD